jgi:outer membrane protease
MEFRPHRRGAVAAAAGASLALLLAAPPLRADLAFSVRTSSGIAAGLARESVYDLGARAGYHLSQLDWQLQPLFFARTELEIRAGSGLTASLAVASGIPAWSGTMTDRDYLNYDGVVTHFSSHDCHAEQALFVDLRGGWLFAPSSEYSLEPFLAVSAMRLRWSARDGYLQYPPEASGPYTPWDPSASSTRVHGTSVLYAQDALYPSVGAALSIHSPGSPDVTLSLSVSPFVLLADTDNHLLRQVDFHESFAGGFAVEPGLAVLWRLSDRTRVDLDLCYRHIDGLIGDSYEIGTGVEGQDAWAGERSATYRDGAGAGFYLLRVSVGFTLSY